MTKLQRIQSFSVDETKDPIAAPTERYLATPCSVMGPDTGRFGLLKEQHRVRIEAYLEMLS